MAVLSSNRDERDDSERVQLLSDIRDLYILKAVDRLRSSEIIEALMKFEIARSDVKIRAQTANKNLSKIMRQPVGSPLLAFERVSYSGADTPLEHTYLYANASNYCFSMNVSGHLPLMTRLKFDR